MELSVLLAVCCECIGFSLCGNNHWLQGISDEFGELRSLSYMNALASAFADAVIDDMELQRTLVPRMHWLQPLLPTQS